MMSHAEYEIHRARRMVEIAEAFLAGRIGGIETARSILDLGISEIPTIPGRHHHDDPILEEVIATFVLVASETDALPVGEVRKLWSQEALRREDIRIAQAEAWCRDNVTEACQKLIDVLRRDKPEAF
jgi:hypothetical protein